MIILRQNTARVIALEHGFYDKTDGVTPEEALTITNEKIHMDISPADATVAPSKILDNVTASTTGSNALNYLSTTAGTMTLALTAANTATLGSGVIRILDAANHCPVEQAYKIVTAEVFDSLERGIGLPASSWV